VQALRGVYTILATPFTPDGDLDLPSLKRLTEGTIAMGVTGITVLGVAGEAQKLTDNERDRVLETVFTVVRARIPIVVGTSRDGTCATVEASRAAQAFGAAGLMIAPPAFLQPGPALTRHFQQVAGAVELPIVLQDYPPVNGVTMSPAAMADLVNAVPAIVTVKLEDPPTPQRMAQFLALAGDQVSVLGGSGGLYLLDELRAGSRGAMTGFAFSDQIAAIWQSWFTGDQAAAAARYYRLLPLLLFEAQPKVGLAIRKEILHRCGLIDHPAVRDPGSALDDLTRAALDETLRQVGLDPATLSSPAG
jgi:4-hydroxy-tetrahydrodipicolinate synthase